MPAHKRTRDEAKNDYQSGSEFTYHQYPTSPQRYFSSSLSDLPLHFDEPLQSILSSSSSRTPFDFDAEYASVVDRLSESVPSTLAESSFSSDFNFDDLLSLPDDTLAEAGHNEPELELEDNALEALPAAVPPTMLTEAEALRMLSDQSHETRLAIHSAADADKGTQAAYVRHVKRYKLWWSLDQDRRLQADPCWTRISSEPVMQTKVAVWLEYESSRPKMTHNGLEIPGSIVGHEHVKQCISALERHRFDHQHEDLYLATPESQKPLRDDARIKEFEKGSRAREPERIATAQVRKAAGTSADNYTPEELSRASMWCLEQRKAPHTLYVGARDRAMLLMSTCTAFRGDNLRSLLWSDLFSRKVPMPEMGTTASIMALICLVDQSKTNQHGRVDEHGAFRHREAKLCSIGALALQFFVHFHVLKKAPPEFAPDFTDLNFGEYGRRPWYENYVFPSSDGDDIEMSYQAHNKRVKLMHDKNSICISKSTHAGRAYAAKTAREYGASVDAVKALGDWSDSDAYRACYDRALAKEALLGAAFFDAKRPESYSLPRASLEPPLELINAIFPFVEGELEALQERRRIHGRIADDYALTQFLDVLIQFRKILLQDAAVLYAEHPSAGIFYYRPFNTTVFREFASESVAIIRRVEEAARNQFRNLLEHIAQSFRGMFTSANIIQERERDDIRRHMGELASQNQTLTNLILELHQTAPRHRSRIASTVCLRPVSILSAEASSAVASSSSSSSSIHISPPSYSASSLIQQTSATRSPSPTGSRDLLNSSLKDPCSSALQEAARQALINRYGAECVQRHQWTWTTSTSTKKPDCWVPSYPLAPLKSISLEDVYTEFSNGLGGCLSIRELRSKWGAEWQGTSNAEKTDASRRKRFYELVEELKARHKNWQDRHVFQFLDAKFHIDAKSSSKYLRSLRVFLEWIPNKKEQGFAKVVKESDLFTF